MSTTMLSIVVVFIAALTYGQTSVATSGAAPAEYQPKGSIRDYFLGAWKLVSTEYKYSDGHTTPYPDLGRDATGFLMYTPSGHMCAQLMKPGRPRWSEANTPTRAGSCFCPRWIHLVLWNLRDTRKRAHHDSSSGNGLVAQLSGNDSGAAVSPGGRGPFFLSWSRDRKAKGRNRSSRDLDDHLGTAEVVKSPACGAGAAGTGSMRTVAMRWPSIFSTTKRRPS